jgi:hypothetical protein
MVLEASWSSLTQVPMTKLGAVTFILLSGISVLAASSMGNAADAQFCEDYAERAAREAALAERFACAFHGQRWIKNAELHRGWCLGAAKTVVQAEAAARSTDLRLCMCEWYADRAAAQAAASAAQDCPFTGPRWTPDRSAHYRWCVLAKAPLATLESEIKTREELLATCARH